MLLNGAEPRVYAESILKICELYLASPLACVAGVTGGDLKRRIEAIMSDRVPLGLSYAKKAGLTVTALIALAMPLTVGIIQAPAVGARLAAQSTAPAGPKFEVASIKPIRGGVSHPPDSVELTLLRTTAAGSRHGLFNMRNVPLGLLIQLAYNVRDTQVLGGLPWTSSDRYEVEAKAESSNATFEQMRPMLQSLLADRFKLVLHRETKEQPVYELAVSKSGLKIEPAGPGSCFTDALTILLLDLLSRMILYLTSAALYGGRAI